METLIVLVIGIFIGWNIPQPQWAKDAQNKLMSLFRDTSRKP